MPSDWWNETNTVSQFVSGKFEKHLFSEKKLNEDLESALRKLRTDVLANNNRLVSRIRAEIYSSDFPDPPEIDFGEFSGDVSASLQEFATEAATDSVKNAVVLEIASGVGGLAAEQLLVAVVARIGAATATSAAAAGGTAAGGAAAGGGGGALAGPVGATAGVVVGLAVGVVIDWWMSSRFEEELQRNLNTLIDELESSVLEGTKDREGLRDSLDQLQEALRDTYREVLYRRIVREG